MPPIKVAVNGYGVIGKRVADAVVLQPDMELVGVADVATDYRVMLAAERGYRLFGSTVEAGAAMREAGLDPTAISAICSPSRTSSSTRRRSGWGLQTSLPTRRPA